MMLVMLLVIVVAMIVIMVVRWEYKIDEKKCMFMEKSHDF